MAGALSIVHAVMGWLVLVGLVAGGAGALLAIPAARNFRPGPFVLTTVVLDVTALVGVGLWFARGGLDQPAFRGLIHPLVLLGTVVTVHVALRRARHQPPADAYRTIGAGLLFGLLLLSLGVPWTS